MKRKLHTIFCFLFLISLLSISKAQTIGNWSKTGGPEGGQVNDLVMTSVGIYAETNEGM